MTRRRVGGRILVLIACAAVAGLLGTTLLSAGASRAALPVVSVFPTPGDPVASPVGQITFRGIPISELGAITVSGSRSGVHSGRVLPDSDGMGGSFLPASPFMPGELVTVRTSLNIVGGDAGAFSFTVATPAPRIPGTTPMRAPRVRGDVLRFASAPQLVPAAVKVTKLPSHAEPGDMFLAPQDGPVQYGPMIIGPYGGLIWFDPLPRNDSATDFRVQTYLGKPMLTWWQGNVSAAGTGAGVDEIYNSSYQRVATVRAGNGISADLHEFQITPQGTALITAYYPVYWNATSVKGSRRQIVLDSVVQEIDIPTGLVLFQWDSLDQVPLNDSYAPLPHPSNHPYDYFHINSIQQDSTGNLIVSSRNTWAVYDLDPRTGAIAWRLNGKHSSFKMGPGTQFAFQHDARLQRNGELTVFDDGAGPPVVHKQSRALTLRLDTEHMTASLVRQDQHRPSLLAAYEGSVQPQSNGDDLVGWGQQPYFTEFNSRGAIVFDAHFVDANSSYRAYRFAWSATPTSSPGIAARHSHGRTTVYASWNGSTSVARWRILAGSSRDSLKPARSVSRLSFETAIRITQNASFFEAQALGAKNQVLGTSATIRVP